MFVLNLTYCSSVSSIVSTVSTSAASSSSASLSAWSLISTLSSFKAENFQLLPARPQTKLTSESGVKSKCSIICLYGALSPNVSMPITVLAYLYHQFVSHFNGNALFIGDITKNAITVFFILFIE